ncbi:tyrosine-type recombinase/integrase [Polynucleobacter paneuropaeus]|nr:tyrosine-type recombinase/integrase [Polynucleobacter paneuropaeus]
MALSNLNFLFEQQAQFAPNQAKILDGQVSVFRRPGSRNWQCRFKLPTGQWHAASTGSELFDQARQQAIAIHALVQARIEQGLAIQSRTFCQIAYEELDVMDQKVGSGEGKKTYADYTFALKKYLIPFFGKTEVSQITVELVRDFEAWRVSQMGLVPKASTKRNHASAYNRVINLARQKGYLGQGQSVPILDATGDRGEARPAFTREDINQLLAYMPTWEQKGRLAIERLSHPLCRAYVEFLLYTGIRHGTEAIPLRWRHIQWHWIGDRRYLRIWVSGKTGPRYLIAKNAVIETLQRLITWQGLEQRTLDTVIEAKLDRMVFCFPNGHTPYRMEGVFRKLMRDSGLAKDGAGKTRTLYSLRHTYATFALAEGVDIHTLARQMGTSVAMIERHYSKMTPMMSAEKLA